MVESTGCGPRTFRQRERNGRLEPPKDQAELAALDPLVLWNLPIELDVGWSRKSAGAGYSAVLYNAHATDVGGL